MDSTDIVVALLAGAVGYGIVTLLLNKYNAQSDRGGGLLSKGKPWWEVLGVAPNASRDEVRMAYWTKMREFQPETLSVLGQEMRSLAHARALELNSALDQFERRFGHGSR